MPVILDTNIVSLLREDDSPVSARIVHKMQQLPASEIWTSVVTYQEQLKGWLAAINRPHNDKHLLWAYTALQNTLLVFTRLPVLPFDEAALTIFHELKLQQLGVGTHDLRIASIALARGAKVITQNVRDFGRVPGLLVEDWTA